MKSTLLSRTDLDFLLFDWLKVDELLTRERYADHTPATLRDVLQLSEDVATRHFAPHNKASDASEPTFDGTTVTTYPEIRPALDAFAKSGLTAAPFPAAVGGLQLPDTVARACFAWFQAANISTASYPFLAIAGAGLLVAHGSPAQVATYAEPMIEGRFLGTMALSEPQAGSSLADITTRAEPQADGTYRLYGNKMWISGGDHDLSENIVHLVLARVAGAPAGVRGISLFIAPKFVVGADGQVGERNDVVVAGLNHKMGNRGTTNCLLNFGEGVHRPGGEPGAVASLIGQEGYGLAYMFHMMNEARIGVGSAAMALGYTGYLKSLEYAKTRPQGRGRAERGSATPQVPIVDHPDVRRMLLAQKAYVEGALALVLFAGRLVDEEETAATEEERAAAHLLLDTLTPIVKSWPSQWCVEANSLAIQVHGGYGYTREYDVEQHYRDNRLNAIHEGTHGIQALDLLGRKVNIADGAGLTLLLQRIADTVARADSDYGAALQRRADRLAEVTVVVRACPDPELGLANASVYLEAAGHVVVAWLWLEQLLALGDRDDDFAAGKRAAARYFFTYELPTVDARLDLVAALDDTTTTLDPACL